MSEQNSDIFLFHVDNLIEYHFQIFFFLSPISLLAFAETLSHHLVAFHQADKGVEWAEMLDHGKLSHKDSILHGFDGMMHEIPQLFDFLFVSDQLDFTPMVFQEGFFPATIINVMASVQMSAARDADNLLPRLYMVDVTGPILP